MCAPLVEAEDLAKQVEAQPRRVAEAAEQRLQRGREVQRAGQALEATEGPAEPAATGLLQCETSADRTSTRGTQRGLGGRGRDALGVLCVASRT